jgi:hypothetical protein
MECKSCKQNIISESKLNIVDSNRFGVELEDNSWICNGFLDVIDLMGGEKPKIKVVKDEVKDTKIKRKKK